MTQFLAEWALRSSILIVSGALLLRALRVKDPSIRLAAWTAMLCASLAIPALMAVLPKLPLMVLRAAPPRTEAPRAADEDALKPGPAVSLPDVRADSHRTDLPENADLTPAVPRTRTGRIWTYVGDDGHPYTVYDYAPNRSRDGPEAFLPEFRGFLQADDYDFVPCKQHLPDWEERIY
jgi:hypothetical protein